VKSGDDLIRGQDLGGDIWKLVRLGGGRTMEASTKPYSKSGLRASSWLWRKAALRTLRKYAMWTVCDAGRWSRVTVSRAMVRDAKRVL
jgi:hypothetical protein